MKSTRTVRSLPRVLLATSLLAATAVASASDLWMYSGRDFTGSFARISRSEPNLSIGAARSIRVGSGVWDACTGQNFTGECRRLSPGDYRELGSRSGDTIASLRDVTYAAATVNAPAYALPRIQLFEGRGYSGRMVNLERSAGNLEVADFGYRPVSAIVTGGTWEICTELNYNGRCQALPPGQYPDLGAQLATRIISVRLVDQPPVAVRPEPRYEQRPEGRPDALATAVGAILGGVIAANTAPPPPPHSGATAPPVYGNPYDRVRVEVYTNPDFGGQAMTLDGDVDSLRNTGFNDRIQSMRVFGGNWEACEDRDYRGACLVFGPGDYRRLPPQLDRSISSMRRLSAEPSWSGLSPAGQNYVLMDGGASRSRHPLWLYEHGNFNGRTLRATGEISDLSSTGMNDVTSSIFISIGTWQFCEHANYGGRCFTLGPGQYSEMPVGMNDTISSFRRVR